MSTMLDWALYYAKGGLAVFPLKPNDKEPDTINGFYDATTDQEQIIKWWTECPSRNIGIATGKASRNIFVIDQDFHPERGIDGKDFLRSWEYDHGKLPETWTAVSATGGEHLYFQGDGTEHCSEDKKHRTGIDIRATGGYIVAPPSINDCGQKYSWDVAPNEVKLASADDRVRELVKLIQKQDEDQKKLHLPSKIEKGCRNWILFQAACSLQSTGFPDEVIETAILELNRVSCIPPLPDKEVQRTIDSALKNGKGGRYEKWKKAAELQKQELIQDLKQYLKK